MLGIGSQIIASPRACLRAAVCGWLRVTLPPFDQHNTEIASGAPDPSQKVGHKYKLAEKYRIPEQMDKGRKRL
jgi:hypothetical protein